MPLVTEAGKKYLLSALNESTPSDNVSLNDISIGTKDTSSKSSLKVYVN